MRRYDSQLDIDICEMSGRNGKTQIQPRFAQRPCKSNDKQGTKKIPDEKKPAIRAMGNRRNPPLS